MVCIFYGMYFIWCATTIVQGLLLLTLMQRGKVPGSTLTILLPLLDVAGFMYQILWTKNMKQMCKGIDKNSYTS